MIALLFAGGGEPHRHAPTYDYGPERTCGVWRMAQDVCECGAQLVGFARAGEHMRWRVVEPVEPGPFYKYKTGEP